MTKKASSGKAKKKLVVRKETLRDLSLKGGKGNAVKGGGTGGGAQSRYCGGG